MSATLFPLSPQYLLRPAAVDPLSKCTSQHVPDRRNSHWRCRGHAPAPFGNASLAGTSRRTVSCSASMAPRHDGQPSSSKDAAERRKLLLQYITDVQPTVMEQFIEQAPAAVVAAMRTTITNMLGTLPPQFFTVTISTVGENLSQLMYSMMMTGYMFRNAQYRLDLHGSLGHGSSSYAVPAQTLQPSYSIGSSSSTSDDSSDRELLEASSTTSSTLVAASILDESVYAPGVQKSRVQGDVLLWHKENGVETMNAVEYIELLEAEVAALRAQVPSPALSSNTASALQQPVGPTSNQRQLPAATASSSSGGSSALLPQPAGAQQQQGVMLRPEELPNELLDYLRALEPTALNELTAAASGEVSAAMDAFVGRLMGTQDKEMLRRAGSDCTAQELGKLMFWLMVVGYTLRGMEVRLEMEGALDLLLPGGGSSASSTWGQPQL